MELRTVLINQEHLIGGMKELELCQEEHAMLAEKKRMSAEGKPARMGISYARTVFGLSLAFLDLARQRDVRWMANL